MGVQRTRLTDKFSGYTRLYEKLENLYLYLPANTNHPNNCLKGLVHGMVYRTLRLTSSPTQQHIEMTNLKTRLLARGYSVLLITEMINKAYQKINNTDSTPIPQNNDDDISKCCFFHMLYHPMDPPSQRLQEIFQNEIFYQSRLPDLPQLLNHLRYPIGINRMIVAYHRPPNLGNLLSPRIIRAEHGPLVSSYLTGN
jgi:hypothetical protein